MGRGGLLLHARKIPFFTSITVFLYSITGYIQYDKSCNVVLYILDFHTVNTFFNRRAYIYMLTIVTPIERHALSNGCINVV